MNINQVKEAVPFLAKHKIVGNLIGMHGVGKSTGVREYAEEAGIGFIDLRLGQMEVGDLLGLPEITTDKNGDKITVFARPKWFPTEGEGVLFLDEINRAKRDVIQAVFQLVLDRKLHDYVLPPGWAVMSAMNPNTADYQTLDLSDRAFLDRFCHIKIASNYEDFINYGTSKGLDKAVTGFIQAHPGMLRDKTEEFNLNFVTPSDRSWTTVARLSQDNTIPEHMLNELVTGLVGTEAATAFLAYKRKAEKPVAGADVLKNYKKVQATILDQCSEKNYRADMISTTTKEIVDIIKARPETDEPATKEFDNLVAFMNDITDDIFVTFAKDLTKTPRWLLKLSQDKSLMPKIERCLVEKAKAKASIKDKNEVPF
jgi:MoxR-like ATPase